MNGKFHMGGVQTAAHVVLVDDVVVHQSPGMVNLHGGRGVKRAVRKSAESAAAPHQKRGADPFSAVNRICADGGGKAFRRDPGREGIFRNGLRDQSGNLFEFFFQVAAHACLLSGSRIEKQPDSLYAEGRYVKRRRAKRTHLFPILSGTEDAGTPPRIFPFFRIPALTALKRHL